MIIHQELALSPYLSIAENIYLATSLPIRLGGLAEDQPGSRQAAGTRRPQRKPDHPPIQHISVGKQQLVEIAKALSKEVKLLILDEPRRR